MSRRLGAAIAAGFLPWSVLVLRGGGGIEADLVFSWGLLNTNPLHAVSLYGYLFEFTMGLPDHLLAWPAVAVLYAAALASVAAGAATGREDRRFTAGTFALAGLGMLLFTVGIGRRSPAIVVAVPVGTLLLWGLAWWSRPG